MSDFGGSSASAEAPPFLSTYSRFCGLWEMKNSGSAAIAAATTTWATANQARYYPITIPFAYPVRRVFWVNGTTATENRDFGIYTTDGVRLYSTGSTAASGASVPQFVDATDFWLPPGDYFFAFNCDSGAANRIWGAATGAANQRYGGVQQQAVGAIALPATATFAAATVAGVNMCGVTWTESGF